MTIHRPARTLAAALAAACSLFLIACASSPPLTPASRTSLESLHASVERVQLQFDRTWESLAHVRDAWDTDPDRSISGYAREISALESRVNELGVSGDVRAFAEWDAQLRSIRAAELAAAPADNHDQINRAFDRADERLRDVRDAFTPLYPRYIDFKRTFRAHSTGEVVEEHLPELRSAVGDSKDLSRRLDRFADTLLDMAR